MARIYKSRYTYLTVARLVLLGVGSGKLDPVLHTEPSWSIFAT